METTDSVVDEAERFAMRGADEGTVVWACEQTNARNRSGNAWYSPSGNLHCAIILRPDFAQAVSGQLSYVTALSAGSAVAEFVTAMTGLRYRWPDQLTINELLAGQISLAAGATDSDRHRYLICALMLNVAHHPPNPEPDEFNSVHASGASETSAVELLEAFTRHFLRWINRWAEDGFDPIRRAWMQRADGLCDRVQFELPRRRVTGQAQGLDIQGALAVETAQGVESISTAEAFGFG